MDGEETVGRIFFGLIGLLFLGALVFWSVRPAPLDETSGLVVQAQRSPDHVMITVTNLGQRSVYLIGGCGKFGAFTGLVTASYSACGSEAIEVQPSTALSSKWVLESTKPVPGEEARACVQYTPNRWSTKRQELCTQLRPS